jgi:sialic acid synthase SpsE
MCLQLDTGNATIGEIEAAIDDIRAVGNENIIIHHCPTGYPARLEGINLRVIQTLKQIFPYPVGFSDHSRGWEMDVAAVALGADLVEKTITEDSTTRSAEHIMSLEPPEMAAFVQLMHDLKVAFGKPRRIMAEAEKVKRTAVRRSVHLINGAKAGTSVDKLEIAFRRPGFGIGPELWPTLSGMKLRVDLPAGHRLAITDLTG